MVQEKEKTAQQRKRKGKEHKSRERDVVRRARGNCIPFGRQRLLKWAKLEFDGEYGVCTLLRDETT